MSGFKFLESERKRFTTGLAVQVRCFHALMIREMMVRYGRDNLGFLWVFVEPMLLCGGVLIVWSFIRSPFEHGIPLVAFALTGYMPLTLWRHITNSGVHPFKRSVNLLYHRHVSLIDVFFTRIALEFAGTTTALVLVTVTLTATDLMDPPRNVGVVVGGWILMCLLSTGSALVIAILTEWTEVAEKFILPFQYVTLPLCGFLFMVDWLPTSLQKIVWYFPTVHCYEMIRDGFYGASMQTYYSPWYPAVWGVGLLAASIGFVERVRDYIQA
jgi:capsular polysaccharide transport system permease protein